VPSQSMKPSRVNRAVSPAGRAGKQQLGTWRMSNGHPQGWPLLFLLIALLASSGYMCDISPSAATQNPPSDTSCAPVNAGRWAGRPPALTEYGVFLTRLLHIEVGMVLAAIHRDRLKKDTSLSRGPHSSWPPSRAEAGEGGRDDGRRSTSHPAHPRPWARGSRRARLRDEAVNARSLRTS
jgi:hypothetical protein